MPEHGREWGRIPDRETQRLDMQGLAVHNVLGLTQYMVSGNLQAAAKRVGVDADGVGAMGLASGARYTVRLARDRLLIVCDENGLLEHGWHDSGYAVTEMSAALEIFELSGPVARDVVKRATTLSHGGTSPCAATIFAGVTACVYRYGDDHTVRIHLDRGLAPYLWNWTAVTLKVFAEGIESVSAPEHLQQRILGTT